MANPRRSGIIFSLLLALTALLPAGEHLPRATTFQGKRFFDTLVAQATKEQWAALPMGDRVARFGLAMREIPYKAFTLEIDDHVESPSCNFTGLDCWTYFEIALGLARMIEVPKPAYTPGDLLAEIEWTRYRGGSCFGHYLDRIHYLGEWWSDNEARGNVRNITHQTGPAIPLKGRKCDEMTVLWKGYRYLRNNPAYLTGMGQIEARESTLPFAYIPKDHVTAVEDKIQSGDIIGIVTHKSGTHCSHVGLAYRTEDGVCHLMHASLTHKKVVLDDSLSTYLNRFKAHAGIIIARPLPRSSAVVDPGAYNARLRKITGMAPMQFQR